MKKQLRKVVPFLALSGLAVLGYSQSGMVASTVEKAPPFEEGTVDSGLPPVLQNDLWEFQGPPEVDEWPERQDPVIEPSTEAEKLVPTTKE